MRVECFNSIREAKSTFEEVGATGFQSFSSLSAVERCTRRYKLLSLLSHPLSAVGRIAAGKRKFRVYAVKNDDEQVILVAPLYLNDEMVWCIAGESHDLDCIDVSYRKGIGIAQLKEAWLLLVRELLQNGITKLRFRELPEFSITADVWGPLKIEKLSENEGVRILLADDNYDVYFSHLAKHAKQNVRTAYNRLTRDGHKLTFEMLLNGVASSVLDLSESRVTHAKCMSIYKNRQQRRYQNASLKYRLISRFCDCTLESFPAENGFLAVVRFDGEIAGFMEGYVHDVENALKVPRLAIDDSFSFYSPGLILINETAKWLFAHSALRDIDLCRGTEKYKFDMGGEKYMTQKLDVIF